MKYIGIRGHRGAGKTTVAFLLGRTIEYVLNNPSLIDTDFNQTFKVWCDSIMMDANILERTELHHVIFEKFGDGPKMLLNMLTGIPFADMKSDWHKDHTIINLKDFTIYEIENVEDFPNKLYTAEEYFYHKEWSTSPEPLKDDVYMTLREVILYFGIYVMQNAFGLNVWVKSLTANSHYFEGLFPDDKTGYRIYSDIKSRSEVSYIKDHGGLIVKVSRPGHEKSGGMDLLRGDARCDYTIEIGKSLYDLADPILEIAKDIIEIL